MPDPYLEVQANGNSRRVPLGDEPMTIGRHPTNKVHIQDPQSSRYHCVIEKSPQGLIVRDLDSSNGTKLNGRVIKSSRIGDGDVVMVGKTTIKVVAPQLVPAPRHDAGGDGGGGDEDFDVVEVEIGDDDDAAIAVEESAPAGRMGGRTNAIEYERTLVRMAESLPDRKFGENDIALVNARGELSHPAKKGAPPESGREAVGVLRVILLVCFRSRASDIHVEPKQEDYAVRIRTDGTMVELARLPKEVGIKLTSLVKILCDIDISQKNIVQEGHFSSNVFDRRVDYRVSFAPAMFGQKLVIRILDTANTPYHVWDLQLPEWMYNEIQRAMKADSGMFLVCGPTGSGKTSTLYAVIRDIDVAERNVVTIEDPVEIQLDGVTQIPVNEEKGNTFSALLRSVLRQDPDAILVGEVRDPETARIALQASITGHLVFSTIHSKDTIGTIFRLLDLGVEPYLVASGLQLVLAQRLVRVLCPACRSGVPLTDDQRKRMGPAAEGITRIFNPRGCPKCMNTGFSGRRGVFELLKTTEEMRDVILKNPSIQDIVKTMGNTPFIKLANSGYQLVADGVTSLEEIERSM